MCTEKLESRYHQIRSSATTRMHSSRMRTTGFSDRLWFGGKACLWSGDVPLFQRSVHPMHSCLSVTHTPSQPPPQSHIPVCHTHPLSTTPPPLLHPSLSQTPCPICMLGYTLPLPNCMLGYTPPPNLWTDTHL